MKWMPLSQPLPLGCPLKVVSAIAIEEGESLKVDLNNAYPIHIYVDGGFAPASDKNSAVESCNATWALAVIAVNEQMQGKLICSSGGHVTFNNESNVYFAAV